MDLTWAFSFLEREESFSLPFSYASSMSCSSLSNFITITTFLFHTEQDHPLGM